ncbi:DUF6114 domain-containing protein [Streptosporangium saharense]|uniref:DUF6114 domain-containing protein n=1 Tax=Streptosporangium saharense TaxID=1706840 RepID=UPI00367E0BBF
MFLRRARSWRCSRPFWGGLFIVLAGAELLSVSLTINALPVAVMFGTVGAGYLIALVMTIAGVLVWLQPGQRVFLGLVAVVLSMASFVYSNLGGFLLGMLLGLLGGMLAMAWAPIGQPVRTGSPRHEGSRRAAVVVWGRRRLRPVGHVRDPALTKSPGR